MTTHEGVPVYHVAQRGGMEEGHCSRTKACWRVGATSKKEAIPYLPTNKSQFVTIPSMEYREYVDKLRLQHTLERARAYDEELLEAKNN